MIVVQLATGNVLLLILQRYYFESESQRDTYKFIINIGCCLSYKDTILKANHSLPWYGIWPIKAVAYPTKILFWKRITAAIFVGRNGRQLLLILQRYYFESESQRAKSILLFPVAVAYPTKILFWKRITADTRMEIVCMPLLLILQRYYFESESQLEIILNIQAMAVAYPTKILFWKRITAASW